MADIHRGFRDVDRSGEEQSFIQFLDLANQLPSIGRYRERMLELYPVKGIATVLDVGCGLGHETIRIAGLIDNDGRTAGIDGSELLIDEARRRAHRIGVSVDFQVGDAHNLTFDDDSFDLCRAERVFLYLEDPAKALDEMARVTRAGGHIIIFDFDYGATFFDSDFPSMTREIETLKRNDAKNPAIGKELPHLMRKAGLEVEAIVPTTLTATTDITRRLSDNVLSMGIADGLFAEHEVAAWWREQTAMEASGTLHHGYHGYIVAAAKP